MKRRTVHSTSSPHTEPVQTENLLSVINDARGLTVTIPDSATLADVEKTLQVAIKGVKVMEDARNRLLPIIGRILLEVEKRKLWKPAYKHFTDFIETRIVRDMGFGRSNAFNVLKIARAYPTLSEDEYQRIGVPKLIEASRVSDESDPEYRTLLDTASKQTVDEFKQTVRTIRAGDTATSEKPFLVGLRLDAETMKTWQDIRNAEPEREVSEIFGAMCDLYVMRDQLAAKIPATMSTTRRQHARAS